MGANLEAANRVVAALRDLGRLEPIDEARATAFVELARAVDADPSVASLWKQYMDAERSLREADDTNDALADLFAALRDPEDA